MIPQITNRSVHEQVSNLTLVLLISINIRSLTTQNQARGELWWDSGRLTVTVVGTFCPSRPAGGGSGLLTLRTEWGRVGAAGRLVARQFRSRNWRGVRFPLRLINAVHGISNGDKLLGRLVVF